MQIAAGKLCLSLTFRPSNGSNENFKIEFHSWMYKVLYLENIGFNAHTTNTHTYIVMVAQQPGTNQSFHDFFFSLPRIYYSVHVEWSRTEFRLPRAKRLQRFGHDFVYFSHSLVYVYIRCWVGAVFDFFSLSSAFIIISK